MIYKLEFEAKAKKEWDKLDQPIKRAFKRQVQPLRSLFIRKYTLKYTLIYLKNR